MSALPLGTVTMVFSDIDGSTRLLQELGDAYAAALSTHRELIRVAVAEGDGHEMGTEGDSFFVVFDSARAAVQTCLRAQQALQRHEWPMGSRLRVRMGVHTGEPLRHEEGYVGLDVHRAARIASAAHGGQVLLSETTWRLVDGTLDGGARLVSLGRHRLKDLSRPEQLYQLCAEGLQRDFPPLRSLGAATSLPVFATPMVGRAEELRHIQRTVGDPTVRVVTLVGPGGSGKTRLAVASAEAVAGREDRTVYFAALETVSTAAEAWRGLAEALGLPVTSDPETTVQGALRDSSTLLVLDNVEQIPDAEDLVVGLTSAAPHVTVLVTSRRLLHVRGEHAVDIGALAPGDASRLFARQAALVRRGFRLDEDTAPVVSEVCARVDGLPLGIELAAARARLLSPAALLSRLDLSLGARTGERPERQRTLRAAVAWSHDLLSPEAREAFEALAVFEGGCDLAGLAAVAEVDDGQALELAEALADASLLTFADAADGEPRLTMLRTVHDFALERLDAAGTSEEMRRRHAAYLAGLVERAAPHLHGPTQLAWMERLRVEQPNTGAALRWCLADAPTSGPAAERLSLGLRIANGLVWYWYRTGAAHEGRELLDRLRDKDIGPDDPELVRAVQGLAVLLLQVGDAEQAMPLLERCLATWRQLGDRPMVARAANSLGVAHRDRGETEAARRHFDDSLAISRSDGDRSRLALTLSNLGQLAIDEGDPEEGLARLEEALAIDRAAGDRWAVVIGETNRAAALVELGRLAEAERVLGDVAASVPSMEDLESTADVLERGAMLRVAQGRYDDAATLLGVARTVRTAARIALSGVDERRLVALMSPAAAALGQAAWDHAVSAASSLSPEAALRTLQPGPA
jgi:predicted ATPase/class 3 adenylate cyclase